MQADPQPKILYWDGFLRSILSWNGLRVEGIADKHAGYPRFRLTPERPAWERCTRTGSGNGERALEDLYVAVTREDESALAAQYLRLDFDLKNLGPLLKEPQPHWHVRNREPRFALPANSNIVVGFLDFLYRNYQEEQWIRWAREVWRSQPGWDELNDPLPPLEAAFKEGKAEVIRANYADDLFRLRKVLDEAFDRAYPLRVDSQWLDLLGHQPSTKLQR